MTAIAVASTPPTMPVQAPEIPIVDLSDWNGILRAFRHAPEWKFGQSWAEKRDKGFRSGKIRIGWRGDRMCYLADLSDREVITRAKKRNDLMWTLGDVLEVFAGVRGHPAYIEYHTAPNGLTLQLLWPDADGLKKVQTGGLAALKAFVRNDDDAVAIVRRTRSGWQVYGEVPLRSLTGPASAEKSLEGQVWDLSFGRYDYSEGESRPVLSSTSPLSQASFHRRQEWRQIHFIGQPSN